MANSGMWLIIPFLARPVPHGAFEGCAPPAPFNQAGLPEKPYAKDEILTYLEQCRQKCHAIIQGLTDEKAYEIRRFHWMEPTFVGLQLYSMRHLQEHGAQMTMFLGQNGITGPDWIAQARNRASGHNSR